MFAIYYSQATEIKVPILAKEKRETCWKRIKDDRLKRTNKENSEFIRLEYSELLYTIEQEALISASIPDRALKVIKSIWNLFTVSENWKR